jgi:hypothetical protein
VHYNQNGQSRGIAEIVFAKPHSATLAADLNGIMVDKKIIKVSNDSTPHRLDLQLTRIRSNS